MAVKSPFLCSLSLSHLSILFNTTKSTKSRLVFEQFAQKAIPYLVNLSHAETPVIFTRTSGCTRPGGAR
jgi:hypothetical protein